jgi:uncharacterized membrane protein YedE/YeeE
METYRMIVLGLLMGAAFGFALEKARVFEPGVIVGQMQFRTFTMLKMFLAATATGLVVLAALNGVWGVKMHPKGTEYVADAVGGLLLGIGIVLAGACPGTLLAQVGVGYRDAWFALAGGLAGAISFGYAEPALKPLISAGPGKLTLDKLLGLPFWAVALLFAAALVAGMVALEKARPWRDDLGVDFDGLPEK